jgi:hypothetical protein
MSHAAALVKAELYEQVPKGHLTIAQRFNVAEPTPEDQQVPKGRLNLSPQVMSVDKDMHRPFSRSFGTYATRTIVSQD